MALVRSSRRINAPAVAVWNLVTDWTAHGRWIPLTVVTVVTVDPGGPAGGLGTRFVGRTALGPIGFDDPMTVTQWQPAVAGGSGRCRITHQGPWVLGWAEIEVRPEPSGCTLTWVEDVRPRWTPRFADPLVSRVGKVMFDGTLRKVAAEVEPG